MMELKEETYLEQDAGIEGESLGELAEQTYLEEDAGIEGESLGWVGHLLAGAGGDSGGLTLPPQPQVAVHHSCTRNFKGLSNKNHSIFSRTEHVTIDVGTSVEDPNTVGSETFSQVWINHYGFGQLRIRKEFEIKLLWQNKR
jgi:hypothetical protein